MQAGRRCQAERTGRRLGTGRCFSGFRQRGSNGRQRQGRGSSDTKQRFDEVAAAVRKEMSSGGRFEFVSRRERYTVDRQLADMQALFNQFGAVDKMDANSKVRLFNDQEEINGILTRNDSDRRICVREVPVGTHFVKMVCETYGELKQEQLRTTEFLNRPGIQRAKPGEGSTASTH